MTIKRTSILTAVAMACMILISFAGNVRADSDILINDNFESGTFESWTPTDKAYVYDDTVLGTSYATSPDFAIQLVSRSGGAITLTDPLPLDTNDYTSVTIDFNIKWQSPSSTRRTRTYFADDGINFVQIGSTQQVDGLVSYTLIEGTETGQYLFTDDAKFQIAFYDSGSAPRAYIDDVVISGSPATAVATQAGDFNGDSTVEAADLALLLGNWGQTTQPGDWTTNWDNFVDANELADLLGNWGAGLDAAPLLDVAAIEAVVPEPATMTLLAIGGLAAMRRRK